MSEPTLEEMRKQVWSRYVSDSKMPKGWPNDTSALALLKRFRKFGPVAVTIYVGIESYGVYVGNHDAFAKTLSEAAIRCAWANIPKGGKE